MGNNSESDKDKNAEYYIYNNKNNSTFLPLLYASGDGIYITLIIYIIYWVIMNYNLIPGLPEIFWLIWIAIFIGIFTISFMFRYFIKKFD